MFLHFIDLVATLHWSSTVTNAFPEKYITTEALQSVYWLFIYPKICQLPVFSASVWKTASHDLGWMGCTRGDRSGFWTRLAPVQKSPGCLRYSKGCTSWYPHYVSIHYLNRWWCNNSLSARRHSGSHLALWRCWKKQIILLLVMKFLDE